ncbi:MAG: DUF2065 domain-containing protein [Pseudomonadota bacterium]
MRWQLLLTGLALMMVFEGMAPFAAPRAWRRAIARIASMPDNVIRTVGGIVMAVGAMLLLMITNV